MQDLPTVICTGEEEEVTDPEVTVIQEEGAMEERENSEPEANNEKDEQTDPAAVGTGEEDTATPLNTEHDDAATS